MQMLLTLSKSVKSTGNVIRWWLGIAPRRNIEGVLWHFAMITAVIRIDAETYFGSVGFALAIIISIFAVSVLMISSKLSDAFGFYHFSSLFLYSVFYSVHSMLFCSKFPVYVQHQVIKMIYATCFSGHGIRFLFTDILINLFKKDLSEHFPILACRFNI